MEGIYIMVHWWTCSVGTLKNFYNSTYLDSTHHSIQVERIQLHVEKYNSAHALNAVYIAMHCSNIVNITVHSESNLYAVCEFLDPNLALLAKQWFFHNSTINSKYIYLSIFLLSICSCCFYAAFMYSYQLNLAWIYTFIISIFKWI